MLSFAFDTWLDQLLQILLLQTFLAIWSRGSTRVAFPFPFMANYFIFQLQTQLNNIKIKPWAWINVFILILDLINHIITWWRRSSTWTILSMTVPLSSVSIITSSMGRQCFSKLLGEKGSTDETWSSLVNVPLETVDAHELLGVLLQPFMSSNCFSYKQCVLTAIHNIILVYKQIFMNARIDTYNVIEPIESGENRNFDSSHVHTNWDTFSVSFVLCFSRI